jgi:hypothetical protein
MRALVTSVFSFVEIKMASALELLKLPGGEYIWPWTWGILMAPPWGIIMALNRSNVGDISGLRQLRFDEHCEQVGL